MTPQGRVGTRGCRELDGERKGGVGGRSRLLDLVGLKTWVYCRRLVVVVGGVLSLPRGLRTLVLGSSSTHFSWKTNVCVYV